MNIVVNSKLWWVTRAQSLVNVCLCSQFPVIRLLHRLNSLCRDSSADWPPVAMGTTVLVAVADPAQPSQRFLFHRMNRGLSPVTSGENMSVHDVITLLTGVIYVL